MDTNKMIAISEDMSDAGLGKRAPISANDDTNGQIDEGGQPNNAGSKGSDIPVANAATYSDEVKQMIKTFKVVDGIAPVDEYVNNRERFRVCQLFGKVYSKILCQSSVTDNTNKFYVLQMLEENGSGNIFVYFRWGRIGAKGQDSLIPFNRDTGAAMAEFETKLHDKAVEGNYEEIEVVFDDETSAEDQEREILASLKTTKLQRPVAELMRDIFSLKIIRNNVKDIGYDAKKMPLGKLSQNSIKMGYNILKVIMKELDKDTPDQARLEKESSKFYTFIPHDIGFKDMRSMLIKTKEQCQAKLDELESLSQIKIAMSMIEQDTAEGSNNVDRYYQDLKNKIDHIDKEAENFKVLEKFLETTHGRTHGFKLDLMEAFELDRENESTKFKADVGGRRLLWHGSRMSNYVGILSQGLRIAPPEAPSTGYMFGKGIYFADMASKSAQYCHSHLSDGVGLLLLCDVACGESYDLTNADYNASNLPAGKHCTKGVGRTGPHPKNEYVHSEGFTIPMGPASKTDAQHTSLEYNEYIVYNTDQVRLKYLLKCRFTN